MPRGVKQTKAEKQLQQLGELKNLGFKIPEVGILILNNKRRVEEGVYEVLQCLICGDPPLELFVRVEWAICRCGRNLSVVWSHPNQKAVLEGTWNPDTLVIQDQEPPIIQTLSLPAFELDLDSIVPVEGSNSQVKKDVLDGLEMPELGLFPLP